MTKQKCIVFDIDGTLFDTRDGIIKALNYVLLSYGVACIPKEKELSFLGPPVRQSFMKLCGFNERQAEEATSLYRKIYTDKFITESRPYEGVRELLLELHALGYVIGIATMKTKMQVSRLLSLFDYVHYFEYIECAMEDGSLTKGQMLKRIKTNSGKYYMVGDTMGDMIAANEAGYTFISADYGYGIIEGDCLRASCAMDVLRLI